MPPAQHPHVQGAGSNIPRSCQVESVHRLHQPPLCGPFLIPVPRVGTQAFRSNWGEIPCPTCSTQGVQWEVEASWEGMGVLPAQARLLSPVLPPAAQRSGSIKVSPCLSCYPALVGAVGTREAPAPPPIIQTVVSMTTAGPSSLWALPHPQSLLWAAISMTTTGISYLGLVWRPKSCLSVTSGFVPPARLAFELGQGPRVFIPRGTREQSLPL